jgi:hypothetical protein
MGQLYPLLLFIFSFYRTILFVCSQTAVLSLFSHVNKYLRNKMITP